jgi:squalene synthase HpnC
MSKTQAVLDAFQQESISTNSMPSVDEAEKFCRNLALSHYENFIVASVFLPPHLKQHFYNIYSYCRVSDDLSDEMGDPQKSLHLLDRWEQELEACYLGTAHHPVFVALTKTIDLFDLPILPFSNLLKAFKQDQIQTRYETYDQLLEYCKYSANPVGHLVLFLCGYRDAERQQLSDFTCTALQLANHWQDIGKDLVNLDRIYIPQEDMDHFGYSESDLRAQICDERFVSLIRYEIQRTRELFLQGFKLCELVDPPMSGEIELFGRSGLELLRQIENVHYDVFRKRPTINKWNRFKILFQYWWKSRDRSSSFIEK